MKIVSRFVFAATVIAGTACLPLAARAAAQQPATAPAAAPEAITVPLSDPSRAGLLDMHLITGSITVKGTDRRDVSIQAKERSDGRGEGRGIGRGRGSRGEVNETNTTGLRRLTQLPSFSVEEQNNRIEISGDVNRGFDFDILVPRRMNLKIGTVNSGIITVENIEGELEVENVNGSISLTNIAGSVVAQTVNGRLLATLTQVTAQKSMAFTSLNGAVDVTLPAAVKATLKLRSDRGDVYSDFDLSMKQAPQPSVDDSRRNGGRYRIEVNRAIYGTVNGGGPEIELRSFGGNVFVRKGR